MTQDVTGIVLAQIKNNLLDPKTLSCHQRRLCIQALRETTNMTHRKIGEFLKCSRATIERAMKDMRHWRSIVYVPENHHKYVAETMQHAIELMERARATGNNKLEWIIRRDLTIMLGKMGVIKWHHESSGTGGDIVVGDKHEHYTNNIQTNTRNVIEKIGNERLQKLAQAIRSSGIQADGIDV